MKKHTIAGIGEILWDVLPGGEFLGGAPINFAYHVNALGGAGVPISTIGRDERGKRAFAELKKSGLDTLAISESHAYVTGYVTAKLDTEGVATYSFPDDVAWDHLQVNDYAKNIGSELDAVCFGSLAQRSKVSRRAIHEFLDGLGDSTVRVFDVNLRQDFYSRDVLESSLERTDILKLNDEELVVMAGLLKLRGSSEDCLMELLDRFKLSMTILSRGARGSILMTATDSSEHPGIATHIKDTIGAGDSFTAAATIGFLQGLSLTEINEKANRLAAYVCSKEGAMVPVPDSLKMLM